MKKKKKSEEYIEMSIDEFDKFVEKMSNTSTCEECANCIYIEQGDMFCDLTLDENNKTFKFMYEEFQPTEDYMWCAGKFFEEK